MHGEVAARKHGLELNKPHGELVVTKAQIESKACGVPEQVTQDVDFSIKQVAAFALAQRSSLKEFRVELHPGAIVGQRVVPVNVARCYASAGR